MEKTWRFKDQDEFEKYAVIYLDKRMVKYEKSLKDKEKNKYKEIYNIDLKIYKNMMDQYIADSDTSTNKKIRGDIIQHCVLTLLNDIEEWKAVSLNIKDTEYRDLITRSLINRFYKCDYICYSFAMNQLSEFPLEFIEDFIYTASKDFTFEGFNNDDIVHDTVREIVLKEGNTDVTRSSLNSPCRIDTSKLNRDVINKIINH